MEQTQNETKIFREQQYKTLYYLRVLQQLFGL